MTTFDAHLNFAITSVTSAPTPATSGTSLVVQDATVFPAVPFNATVWPLLTSPTSTNAEIVRVTNIASNTLSLVRAQEGSTAKTILATYQIAATITAKAFTDLETAINSVPTAPAADNTVCSGRLTLTSLTPVTTADVLGATNIFFTPYKGKYIALFDGVSTWTLRTLTELTLAVPASTSTMYDVFIYDNAGTPAIEALAWTNDTTRGTALVLQDGVYVKSGVTTRRYVGSFRTTTVSGQTEDSLLKRYVWNYYNRVNRVLTVTDATASWNYTINTWRQARGSTANQVEVVIGVAETAITFNIAALTSNGSLNDFYLGLGFDSTTTPVANIMGQNWSTYNAGGSTHTGGHASVDHYPTVGRHFYAWLEKAIALGTHTWYGTGTADCVTGVTGRYLG